MHGDQSSLAFELTTPILRVEVHIKCALGAMATMDDYVKGVILCETVVIHCFFES